MQSVPTLYSRIGDSFAWLSIAALFVLVVRTVARRSGAFSGSEPLEAPLPVA
jgi:hypothetical protein